MKLLHVLLIAGYCCFLFWLSSGPVSAPVEIRFDGMDKVAHVCAFGLLAGLVFNGLRRSGRSWTPRALFWIPVCFVALYGASDEFHQFFVPSRNCDVFDWMADVTGALLSVTLFSLTLRYFRKPVSEPLAGSGE